ncbi:unnamed protein product [Nippostrongylus brasiliensis]|uniref:ATP-dependent Clp protease proteolytic subunit n=1 Tax=Nippostrongylus brasiliensis TaxID=27835 RepID=A0A0N4XTP9_NIPBR|nr:unnamed protein product [Nippostrongylus brasiliensis]
MLRRVLPAVKQLSAGIRQESSFTPPTLATIPFVIENEGRGERSYDIYSRLLRDRIVCIMTPLLFLQSDSSKRPIHVYINSPGGSVTAGLAIYDTMQMVTPPVATWCVGQASSMGSLLLCAGEKGMRTALPNSRIMVHQPSGGAQVIQETLDRDRFMSALEAKNFGLVDKVEAHKGSMPTE